MNIKTIIVDDEPAAIEILENYVSQVPAIQLVGSFLNPIEALAFVQSSTDVDLIFLDINMPNLSGLGFLELLKSEVAVVLTTAYSEYAVEGFKHGVVDYLTKPIPFTDFLRSVQRVQQRLESKTGSKSAESVSDDFLMVKTDHKGKYTKVLLSDILYIESMKNYVAIYTTQREQIITLLSMKNMEERLPEKDFFRVHKSFIVALNHIKAVDGGEIVLSNAKDRIPLSATYRNAFFELLEKNMMN